MTHQWIIYDFFTPT